MKLKEFLKPDWRKIAIFVSVIVFSFIIQYLESTDLNCEMILPAGYERCDGWIYHYPRFLDTFVEFSYSLWMPSELIYLIFYETSLGKLMWQNIIIFSIPSLIFWYLLSCFIVWIYVKFRKVKKK